jgi:hypothetical protein
MILPRAHLCWCPRTQNDSILECHSHAINVVRSNSPLRRGQWSIHGSAEAETSVSSVNTIQTASEASTHLTSPFFNRSISTWMPSGCPSSQRGVVGRAPDWGCHRTFIQHASTPKLHGCR